ncbi:hypothetical protein JOF56_000833 [Kibdelosporangium banguiense]|uniref:Uncharacterized protein n=1 Tax=Kibdelosporangium banguiense TaxID=1365924 RepID=A0ABS4T7Q2_9PSEU|nr:hypothetical protein [Kibdelosporangium banguiense]MBP2320448.1 hypothetical protein [Kibdelosporangium banguiense]
MTLPPGRQPIPAPGINAATDPELAESAAELNAWVDYLSHPETNNGPRIYRPVKATNVSGQTLVDVPVAHPYDMENDPDYRVVSALDGFATVSDELFRAAQGVSGVNEVMINEAYAALTQGCFTFPPPAGHSAAPAPTDRGPSSGPVRDPGMYAELSQVRTDWMAMRHDWVGWEFLDAQLFEDDLIRFQVYLENGFLRVAEALVKYRAIHQQAGKDIAKQMDGVTERFSKYQQSADFSIDLKSLILTGIVEVGCAILSGGLSAAFKVKSLGEAAIQVIGDGGKTAKYEDHQIDDNPLIFDTVKQYVAAVNQIESRAARAIKELWLDLHTRLAELENGRRYTNLNTGVSSDSAPQFMDYAKNWRI